MMPFPFEMEYPLAGISQVSSPGDAGGSHIFPNFYTCECVRAIVVVHAWNDLTLN